MLRKLLAILGAYLLMCATAFPQRTDRERDGLKGPVKTVRVRQAKIVMENGKETASPLTLISAISYDPSGSRTELTLFDLDGNVKRRIAYEYDPQSRQPSGLISYNSRNEMVRRVSNKYGPNGTKMSSTIIDFNEDGTIFRRTELTQGSMGELQQVAEFDGAGNVLKKKDPPTKESVSEGDPSESTPDENKDRPVMEGYSGGEYFDLDSHGNWTRGLTRLIFRTYGSGASSKTQEWSYREFTYY